MTNCAPKPQGQACLSPSDWAGCRPWDLTEQDRHTCYMDGLAQEALNIAGAKVNVYKLLGVHEQTRLLDLTGDGSAISGGDAANYPKGNAFTTYANEWRSLQAGSSAIAASSFIGYDFGVVKIPNGRNRYADDKPIRQHITTIKIKQSSNPNSRALKVRVERSDDGLAWRGVAILTLPDNDALNTIHFKHSVPSRFWRLRPITFEGNQCDSWGVQALEMHDYSVTHISNVQDKILMENRDRDYSDAPVLMKGYYELQNTSTDLSRFGIEIPTANYQIRVSFSAAVSLLGRPVVIGDIVELPSETQYTTDLTPVKRWLEVTDVTWDVASYTPGWVPTMLLITAQPALATQETQDIFGDLGSVVDSSGLYSSDDGNNPLYQDFSAVDQTILAVSQTQVPLRGSEGSNTIREFEPEELEQASTEGFPHLNSLGFNRTGLYVEDAMPQNGASYTEGPTFPTTPSDGEYHRLTYVGLAGNVPARLFRWSSVKNRWIYLETDRRTEFKDQKAKLEEYTTSPNKVSAREVK